MATSFPAQRMVMRNLSFLRQPLQCSGFPGSSVVEKKNPLANAEKAIDSGSIPGSGRSAGGGNGNPIQCFCLGNPMDRRVWWATVNDGIAESDKTW